MPKRDGVIDVKAKSPTVSNVAIKKNPLYQSKREFEKPLKLNSGPKKKIQNLVS
jgi:hypothetical protein